MNRITDYGKLATDITTWIKDYAITNNIKSLVVGVSGGIDSAVVSTLCAMTGITTWCAVLPIEQNPDHTRLAVQHIHSRLGQYANVGYENIDLTQVFRAMYIVTCGTFSTEHSWSNTKSRLRMTYLYQLASSTDGIVVGTGNKVEDFGIGFFTKYGDGGVDISPIANLYKTEVRELGRYLGIADEIIDAAPTDGLWADGRTDEQQIGCTYEELEWAMNEMSDSVDTSLDDSTYSDREETILVIYNSLHIRNQHKMQSIPIYKLPL